MTKQSLSKNEPAKAVNGISTELFGLLKKYCSDPKAFGISYDVSQYLAKTAASYSWVSRVKEIGDDYIGRLKEKISKRKCPDYDDVLFDANEALVELLHDKFEISFSVSERKRWPGCFGHTSKKEKF